MSRYGRSTWSAQWDDEPLCPVWRRLAITVVNACYNTIRWRQLWLNQCSQYGVGLSAILNLKILNCKWVIRIYFSIQNFIKVSWHFTEIWRYDRFQYGGLPPYWILLDFQILTHAPSLHLQTTFRENHTICCRLVARNYVLNMAFVRHLECHILNFVQILFISSPASFIVPSFTVIGSFLADIGLCRHNLYRISGRLPSCISDDVISNRLPSLKFHGPSTVNCPTFSRWSGYR